MKRVSPIFLALALTMLCLATGCGKTPAVVNGKVLFNGQNVGKGAITFVPADGKGPADGGQIIDGQYRVEITTPGKKSVQIVGVKKIRLATSSAEMAQQAAETLAKKSQPVVEMADEIPSDSEGNNALVEITAGAQTLDFELKTPAGKPR